MSRIQTWLKTASPISKLLMAISITSALVVCHKMVYAPYVRRTRYRRAEEWANMIIEQEEQMGENNNGYSGTNNISY